MSVRAKLQLISVTEYAWKGPKRLTFTAIYDPTIPEDQRFQEMTPNATAEFTIDNPEAMKQFELGAYYHVDFSPAPKPVD